MNEQELPPFGWYPDPAGAPLLRWWTGTKWTHDLEAPRVEVHAAVGYTASDRQHALAS